MSRTVCLWVALISLGLAAMPVRADEDMSRPGMMGYGMGPGMMGGRGMMGGDMGMGMDMMGGGLYQMLNLTDDQRTRINKLQDAERHQHWATLGKMMDERARLRDLYAANNRDVQAILKVQDQMHVYQRKMMELHLNTQNQIEALLTPEQREHLKSMRRGMPCGPGMMAPGGPRGMMR